MALIDLLNNDPSFFYYSGQGNFTQKSIPYGNDQPGGGSSNQPFIQFPLPEDAGVNTKRYYELNRTGNDFPLRGGSGTSINSLVPIIPDAAVIDRDRISKFYSTTKGNIFLQKQKYLQYANPKMEVGQGVQPFGQQIGTLIQGGTEYTRIYNNGKNTLQQVGVMGSGIHFDRHGSVPINPFQLKYEYVVKNKSKDLNRLVSLYRSKITTDTVNILSLGSSNYNLGISPDPTLLFEYPGGPDSVGGIGFTTIERKVNTEFDPNLDINQRVYTFTYNQLSNAISNDYREKGSITQDFRKQFQGAIPSSDYIKDNITVKYGIDTKIGTGDIINKADNTYRFIEPDIDPWSNINSISQDDLVRFGFEAMNYNPIGSIFVQFRAYITSFADNHQANYNSVKYIGRGETFYAYDGFTRNIGFGFIIAALSKDELMPIYDKLNLLISQIYPDYGDNSFMRTPVVKMTIGDYLYRQPGFLNSLNVDIETNYPWEIYQENRMIQRIQLPQVLSVDCGFTPVHDFLPRRTQATNAPTRLINQRRIDIPSVKSASIQLNTNINTTPLIPFP